MLGQIVDWFYGQIVGFLGNFFSEMGGMGAELFEMSWVQSVVLFFSYLGWALFAMGLVVACFECGVEYSGGRGNVKETALNAMKGFLAVSLFTQVPVRLYELAVSLQADLTAGITGFGTTSIGDAAKAALENFNAVESLTTATSFALRGFGPVTSGLMVIFCLALMAYAVIKVSLPISSAAVFCSSRSPWEAFICSASLADIRTALSNGASRSSACACRHSCRPPFLLQDSWYLRTMPCWVWGSCSLPVRSPVSPEPLDWIPPPKQAS